MRRQNEPPLSGSSEARTLAAGPFLRETSFTIVPTFVDANVLVYADDRDAGSKHDIARDLVAEIWHSGDGVLSVQVPALAEERERHHKAEFAALEAHIPAEPA